MSASQQRKTSFFSRTFPVPTFLTFDPVGIELTPTQIRVFKFKDSKHGRIPEYYKTVDLPEVCEALESVEELDQCQVLRQELQKLKDEFGFTHATVSVPESKTYIFRTQVPKSSLGDLHETLGFKIEENIPLDPSNVIFDYKVLESHNKHQEHVDVVVSALSKDVIQAYSMLFEQVGIVPIGFKPESTALARAVLAKDDQQSYVIINIAKEKVGLAIVDHQAVHYASTFPISGEQIVADFQSSAANGFKEHVNKLLVYWFTNQHDPDNREKIQTAILVGDYAMAPGLTLFLENKLKINIEIGSPWHNCFDINTYIPELSRNDALSYATVIGLAL